MNKIGIFRRVFPLVSEAFIQEQACNMKQFEPIFIASTQVTQTPFSSIALSNHDFLGIKQAKFLITRSAKLFKNSFKMLSELKLIHAHFGIDGVYAMALADQLKIPFLVTFHGYDITLSREHLWQQRKFLYYQLILHEAEMQTKASAFIAVSNFIRNKLLEKGYPPEKIIKHYIGIDTNKFSPTQQQASDRYILCVGRHTEKKGIDTLLKAFAIVAKKHLNVSLIQVGKGALTHQLLTLTKQLGISDRVHFLGSKPHDKVLELMRNAEIFALPSQTAKNGDCEGLPIVINEASACGIPVVATDHSGIPEAIIEGETGFLVSERDYLALATKLDILLCDRALGKKMGKEGREFVCEKFDINRQTKILESIYEIYR